jgi:arylsulfatase A-like enzyme
LRWLSQVHIRDEVFNAFNRTNLNSPTTNVSYTDPSVASLDKAATRDRSNHLRVSSFRFSGSKGDVMINRREFLRVATTVGAAAVTGIHAEGETESPEPIQTPKPRTAAGAPNVLIFMPDQQNGATVLPGSPVLKPHMDRFLQESVAFNSAYCPAPHCCPSRASFMTGLYPSEHGIYNNVDTDTAIHPNPFPGTEYWGKWLQAAGYGMGYAGKLHVGRDITPETCGFEDLSHLEEPSFEGSENSKVQLWKRARLEQANAAVRKPGEILRPEWTNLQLYGTSPDSGSKGYENLPDYRIMQAGIAGMKRLAADKEPWCVMISNSGAHDTYFAPKEFVDLYDPAKIELPASFEDTMDDKPRIYQRQRYEYWSQLSDEETRDALRHYYAKCTMQDAIFGEMLQALQETGQADNTIVIYVSDHGVYRASHGLWMKGIPSFREAYHIPAVIRWPKGMQQAGRQVDALIAQVDWAPTILEACGVMPQKKLSGMSLIPWLRNEMPSHWRDAIFSQMNGVELYYTQRITMTKDWKYVYNGFDLDELYDLRNDPHEMRNLTFPDLSAKRDQVLAGKGLPSNGAVPWPSLPEHLASVRKKLLEEMWTFAAEHNDIISNPYGTVALAPFGPGLGATPGRAEESLNRRFTKNQA